MIFNGMSVWALYLVMLSYTIVRTDHYAAIHEQINYANFRKIINMCTYT